MLRFCVKVSVALCPVFAYVNALFAHGINKSFFSIVCNLSDCHQYDQRMHIPATVAAMCQGPNGMGNPGQDHSSMLHSTFKPQQHSSCCCTSCVAVANATKSLEKREYHLF